METFKDLALDSAMVMAEDNDIAVGDIACEPSGVRVREQGTNVENKIKPTFLTFQLFHQSLLDQFYQIATYFPEENAATAVMTVFSK